MTITMKRHAKKLGLIGAVLIELAVAYGLASLAIDRGNLGVYLLTVVFIILAIRNFSSLIRSLLHGH